MQLFFLTKIVFIHCDAANFLANRIQFQDPATPIMEGIIDLHHYICFFLILTLVFVTWMLVAIILRFGFFPTLHFYTKWYSAEYKFLYFFYPIYYKYKKIFEKFSASPKDGVMTLNNQVIAFLWCCVYNYDLKSKQESNKNKLFEYIFSFQNFFKSWYLLKFKKYKPEYAKEYAFVNKGYSITHGTTIEIIWTIIPSIILIIIAIPSFILLYSMDEVVTDNLSLTIKVIGHQWYWSYQISDLRQESYNKEAIDYSMAFDSYMVQEEDLNKGELRLLEVDNALKIPVKTHIRVIVSSTDVLHSWAVPSLGVKVDAVPGRLNQTSMFIKRDGLYYGQCSEICGINHAFMPIKIQTIPKWWVNILHSI